MELIMLFVAACFFGFAKLGAFTVCDKDADCIQDETCIRVAAEVCKCIFQNMSMPAAIQACKNNASASNKVLHQNSINITWRRSWDETEVRVSPDTALGDYGTSPDEEEQKAYNVTLEIILVAILGICFFCAFSLFLLQKLNRRSIVGSPAFLIRRHRGIQREWREAKRHQESSKVEPGPTLIKETVLVKE